MNRGDVVEVAWPFSDRTGSKTRPAVVVQGDFLNGLIDDTVLVQVTGTRHGIPGTEVQIDPASEPGSALLRLMHQPADSRTGAHLADYRLSVRLNYAAD